MKLVIIEEEKKEDIMDTEAFSKAFWDWFDSLPIKTKKIFWYYRDDTARIYFYFQVYEKLRNGGRAV